jgi:type II secretory pathway component GspD/PulD (secretin)
MQLKDTLKSHFLLRTFVLTLLLFLFAFSIHTSYAQENGPTTDPIIIQVIPLDYANAEYLSSVLAPLLTDEGQIVAYMPTNSLIIKDRKSQVVKLVKIIKGDSSQLLK